jgi:O-antigen/teichoic acid export membrane protein
MPFWVVSVTGTLYANADVSLMSFRTSDIEVGWYGASVSLVGTMMLFTVIMHNVFLPMISRASPESSELSAITRRALELVVSLMTPVALFAALAAEIIVRLLFGESFAPAAASLRILSGVVLLLYVSICPALVLTRLDRGWTVTWVSIGTLVLNLALNWFAIPYGQHTWGPGGAGIAAAGVWAVCEILNVATLLSLSAGYFLDRRNLVVFAKTGIACAAVALVHATRPSSVGTIAAEAALYLVLVVAMRAVRVDEVAGFARLVLRPAVAPAAPC